MYKFKITPLKPFYTVTTFNLRKSFATFLFNKSKCKFNSTNFCTRLTVQPKCVKYWKNDLLFCTYALLPVLLKYANRVDNANERQQLENKIVDLIIEGGTLIKNDKLQQAKIILQQALVISETEKLYKDVTTIYDLLATVALHEGSIAEAEAMLVRFIEKLLSIGYKDTDNSIVRFKLKLARLYQIVGNNRMAEIGFQNCIATQEAKLKENSNDELTDIIYLSSLYWYGCCLIDSNRLDEAKHVFAKALNVVPKVETLSPMQVMIVLYHAAEVSFKLEEYDNAIEYLNRAIDIGSKMNSTNSDLPSFYVKLGIVYLYKGIYDKAMFWCEHGHRMAKGHRNYEAEDEGLACLVKLNELKKSKEF